MSMDSTNRSATVETVGELIALLSTYDQGLPVRKEYDDNLQGFCLVLMAGEEDDGEGQVLVIY